MFKLKEISSDLAAMSARLDALEKTAGDLLGAAEAKDAEISALTETIEEKEAELVEEKAKSDATRELMASKEEDLEVESEIKAVEKLAEIGHTEAVADSAEAPKTLDDHIKIYQAMSPGADRLAYAKKNNVFSNLK